MGNERKKQFCHLLVITMALFASALFATVSDMALPDGQAVEVQAATLGESNALRAAKSYLETMPFSKKGLIKQLKYSKYSTKEAKYAVNHCNANWKKQAAKQAKQYLKLQSFSRDGLMDQLLYEGYTKKEAAYGVKKAGYGSAKKKKNSSSKNKKSTASKGMGGAISEEIME